MVLERLDGNEPVPQGFERRNLAAIPVNAIHVKNFIPSPCLVYPRPALEGRRFDPSLVLIEDWDFVLNVMAGTPLRHVPIDGPVIHTRVAADNRRRSNDHLLVATYLQIYANRPAPTHERHTARQALLASVGVDVPSSAV